LEDIEFLLAFGGSRHRKRGLTDTWYSNQSRGERQVGLVNDQPAGEQLLQDLALPNPLSPIR
jgi:hypothetical protein